MPILQIRDKDGKFIPINAIKGNDGKSAYEQAKEGGYSGTEAEFIAMLNGLTNSEDAAHYSDFNNPHKVTAQQVGALPTTGGVISGDLVFAKNDVPTLLAKQGDTFVIADNMVDSEGNVNSISFNLKAGGDLRERVSITVPTESGVQTYNLFGQHYTPSAGDIGAIPAAYTASGDLDLELTQGGNQMTVCSYHSETLNTPYKEGATVFAHGMVITNANSNQYGTQLCMPSGSSEMFVRSLSGSGKTQWVKVIDTEWRNNMYTKAERLRADIDYIAVMTGVEL